MSVCTELSQRGRLRWKLIGSTSFLRHRASKTTTWPEYQTTRHKDHPPSSRPRAQELCESSGGHSWAPVPNKPTVSVDVKQRSTNRNRAGLSDRRVVNPATPENQAHIIMVGARPYNHDVYVRCHKDSTPACAI